MNDTTKHLTAKADRHMWIFRALLLSWLVTHLVLFVDSVAPGPSGHYQFNFIDLIPTCSLAGATDDGTFEGWRDRLAGLSFLLFWATVVSWFLYRRARKVAYKAAAEADQTG